MDVNHFIRLHEWLREQANLHASKLFLRVFILELQADWTRRKHLENLIKVILYQFYRTKYMFSLSVAPRKIRAKLREIICLRIFACSHGKIGDWTVQIGVFSSWNVISTVGAKRLFAIIFGGKREMFDLSFTVNCYYICLLVSTLKLMILRDRDRTVDPLVVTTWFTLVFDFSFSSP